MSDPSRYPVLTREDRRRLAFGAADRRHRTRVEQDAAWEALPGCEILTRKASTSDGRRGWLVVPEEAAAAIRAHPPEPPTKRTHDDQTPDRNR